MFPGLICGVPRRFCCISISEICICWKQSQATFLNHCICPGAFHLQICYLSLASQIVRALMLIWDGLDTAPQPPPHPGGATAKHFLSRGIPTCLQQLPQMGRGWRPPWLPSSYDFITMILSPLLHPSFLEQGNCSNKPTWLAKEVICVMEFQDPMQALGLEWPFPVVLH